MSSAAAADQPAANHVETEDMEEDASQDQEGSGAAMQRQRPQQQQQGAKRQRTVNATSKENLGPRTCPNIVNGAECGHLLASR
jgi:hypothetical protein